MPAPTMTKFKIIPPKASGITQFVAMINPEGYTINTSIKYCSPKIPGQAGQTPRFQAVLADKITLKPFIIDGTGTAEGNTGESVDDQIAHLKAVTAQFDGEEHECRVVQLVWSSFQYEARLESMGIEYTLFSPSGTPLRAKVALGFVQSKRIEEIQAEAKLSSPDLTHIVEVKAGDSLPLLCNRIYKCADHVEAVARFNGLTSLRDIVPGTHLHFPPLAV